MIRRNLRWAVLLLAALPGVQAYARAHHSEGWAREHFAAAERMREALNGRPPADRTRRDYQRVINSYRSVYFGAPASSKADPSVVAVAETLVEMGRRFDDDKILNSAIAQYKFLRKEYPGSRYRCDALFTVGEIYKDDLNSPEQARSTFQEFLHRYPHNRLVEDAQQAISELDRQADAEIKAARKKPGKEIAERGKGPADSTPPIAAIAESRSTRFPRVTGIRHWSTPDYTRIAIDLESEVKFGSQRIANPDRIFFDLRDTKLASTLVGKSFDVDDGFLKKIRVAQFQPGRTRVVLEVADLSDYDAFLLPNPYRLIIDIHGKDKDKDGGKVARTKPLKDGTELSATDVEAPPVGATKAALSGAELKADLKAEAGKAPVTTEDVADGAKIVAKTVAKTVGKPALASTNSHPGAKPAASAANASPIPKVVVEADDEDDSPAPSKRPTPTKAGNTRSLSKIVVANKGEKSADDDSATSDDINPGDPPAATHMRGKALAPAASSRLAGSRNNDIESDIHEAKPTASGDRSLIRALGLKIGRIVIDPGHGGHDTGTIGPNGLEEKDLVLEVGRRLGKLLETRLGAEVVYTRKNDTFIPLETRTAIANQQRADLFISIHANSSHDPAARGVETYYLNFTSSPEALEVAARENAVSEKSIYELQDLVKKIALKEKIEESREFAGNVQESLHSGLAAKSPGIRDRGVKKAPFIVLIGANMPSILAEISFVSNPADEHRLETSEYRQRIAESLYRGIAKYCSGLSGVKVASKLDKVVGQ
jgi:N-acetylmuramoyl-L-alanine amidase